MNLKRPLLFIGCMLMLFKCNDEPVTLPKNDLAKTNETNLAAAIQVARNYSGWDKTGKRRTLTRQVDEPVTFVDDNQSPLFYAFNFKDEGGGFIIVSGDKRAVPVLAFGDHGSAVDWENAHLVNGLKLWLDIAKEKMKHIKARDTVADSRIVKLWEQYSTLALTETTSARQKNVPPDGCSNCVGYYNIWGPLLATEWSQHGITNADTPLDGDCICGRKPAGCGPVAMGQVIRYHAPNSLFNYAAMPLTSDYSCGASTTGEQDLAALMLTCGVGASAVYNYIGCNTLTVPTEIPGGLEFVGMSSGGSVRDITVDRVASEISSGNPVIMYGYDNILTEWHIWVCDGIRVDWLKSCDGNTCRAYQYALQHLNWGWGPNSGNGWFAYGDYSPGSDDFDGGLKMISGIRG